MSNRRAKRLLWLLLPAAAVWLGAKYIFPLALPFLGGLLLALAAEPAVKLLSGRCRLTRGSAAFFGVTATLVLLGILVVLLCGLLVKELGRLARILPDLEHSARQGLYSLEDWLLGLAMDAPEGIRPLLTRTVLGIFDNGSAVYDQALAQLPQIATGMLSHLTGSFVGIGTGLLSAYFISARLPEWKQALGLGMPRQWRERYLPALQGLKSGLVGWLKAQSRLLALTFALVCGGLLLLGISYAPVWAALIALVDAVPMLGTGIVLVPWSIIALLQENPVRALGLLAIFAIATVTRCTLEPRLLGKQLGLDPLVTLVCLYVGYQLFGIPGMLLSPLLGVAVIQLVKTVPPEE